MQSLKTGVFGYTPPQLSYLIRSEGEGHNIGLSQEVKTANYVSVSLTHSECITDCIRLALLLLSFLCVDAC